MTRFRIALAAWLTLALTVGIANTQVPQTGAGKGTPGAPAGFSGPGDVVSGATAFWGAQAYTAAYASGGGQAFNVCLALDATCGDLVFDATGAVVDSAIGGFLCSAVTCTIKTFYDHTGNGNFRTQATEALRPTITFNCQNGHACVTFPSGKYLSGSFNGGVDIVQPFTYSAVYIDTGSSAVTYGGLIVSTGGAGQETGMYSGGTDDVLDCFANTDVTRAAPDNAWHYGACVLNDASSEANVDGTSTTGTAGARDLQGNVVTVGSSNGSTTFFVGKMAIARVDSVALSGANMTALSSNAHTFWGF